MLDEAAKRGPYAEIVKADTLAFRPSVIRMEAGHPVDGTLVVLRRSP